MIIDDDEDDDDNDDDDVVDVDDNDDDDVDDDDFYCSHICPEDKLKIILIILVLQIKSYSMLNFKLLWSWILFVIFILK